MKVLIIIHNQYNTGPFNKIIELADSLIEEQINVTVLATSKTNHLVSEKIYKKYSLILSPDLLWGKLRQGFDLLNTFFRIFFILKNKFDIVYAIDSRPVVIIPSLFHKLIYNKPLVLAWWDWFGRGGTMTERSGKLFIFLWGWIETFFEERFRRFADVATVISNPLRSRLMSLGFPNHKIHLLRVGSKICNTKIEDKILIRSALGLNLNKKYFCYVGAIFKNDLNLLLNSLTYLKYKIENMPITLIIGDNSIEDSICKDLSIIKLGKVNDQKLFVQYLKSCDYGLLPLKLNIANNARWPSKIGDYLSCGLPLVATPTHDLELINASNKIGFLSKDDDPVNFAETLFEASQIEQSSYDNLSLSALDFAKNELNWDNIAKKTIDVFNSFVIINNKVK